ncbi:cytochrome B [Sphingobium sp. Leaf26]|nr:cytochrome B [Sphingobium sp. Leaf26]
MRLLHWIRAILVLGMLSAGWLMTRLEDVVPSKYGTIYPLHKSFGLLLLGLVVIQIIIRLRTRLPKSSEILAPWEKHLAKLTHATIYLLLVAVPLMGYAMSSSYSHSDGITLFGLPVAELLPKNDTRFAMFQWLHRTMAYGLLALMALHVAGVVKHRYFDKRPGSDVLRRML